MLGNKFSLLFSLPYAIPWATVYVLPYDSIIISMQQLQIEICF